MVLLAAGSGSRVGADRNKVLLTVQGLPVLAHSLRAVEQVGGLVTLVVVAREGEEATAAELARQHTSVPFRVVTGGATRHASEWAALQDLGAQIDVGDLDVVAIHDSARPLATPELWRAVVTAADRHGGAIPARPQAGLIERSGEGREVLDLVGVQTPQAFRARPLLAAYRQAAADGFEGTDTAACVARHTDLPIVAVPAPATNLKVTFAEDVALAERLLSLR